MAPNLNEVGNTAKYQSNISVRWDMKRNSSRTCVNVNLSMYNVYVVTLKPIDYVHLIRKNITKYLTRVLGLFIVAHINILPNTNTEHRSLKSCLITAAPLS